MKTFQQFQQDIQEKTGLIRKSFELGKRLVSGGKKFLGKKTVPGTKIKLPLGMSRGEAGLLQIGASGTLGKTIIDRKKKRKEFDNMMKFNYQEETKVLFGKPKSHREKVTKKLNKFSATFDLNKSPKFGLKIFGQDYPPKAVEIGTRLAPRSAVDRALEKYKKEKKVNESVAALAVKSGSKLIPALMTGIGAAGTIMQARKKNQGYVKKSFRPKEKEDRSGEFYNDIPDNSTDKTPQVPNMDDKLNTPLVDKETKFVGGKKVDKATRKRMNKPENQFEDVAIANNVGDGKIAGTVEAGDDPPVKKKKKKGKKKRYIYGGRGSRKMWMK